jgi:hypothetical protein
MSAPIEGVVFDLIPNPATDMLTVHVNTENGAGANVRILSITGQQMVASVMLSTQNGSLTIPVANLASGLYVVEVVVDGQKMVKQLIRN